MSEKYKVRLRSTKIWCPIPGGGDKSELKPTIWKKGRWKDMDLCAMHRCPNFLGYAEDDDGILCSFGCA